MQVATKREFEIDGEEITLTVVGESSKRQDGDNFNAQLVYSWLLRSKGYLHAEEVTDVETQETFTVTKIETKLGFTYLTVTRKNMIFG